MEWVGGSRLLYKIWIFIFIQIICMLFSRCQREKLKLHLSIRVIATVSSQNLQGSYALHHTAPPPINNNRPASLFQTIFMIYLSFHASTYAIIYIDKSGNIGAVVTVILNHSSASSPSHHDGLIALWIVSIVVESSFIYCKGGDAVAVLELC